MPGPKPTTTFCLELLVNEYTPELPSLHHCLAIPPHFSLDKQMYQKQSGPVDHSDTHARPLDVDLGYSKPMIPIHQRANLGLLLQLYQYNPHSQTETFELAGAQAGLVQQNVQGQNLQVHNVDGLNVQGHQQAQSVQGQYLSQNLRTQNLLAQNQPQQDLLGLSVHSQNLQNLRNLQNVQGNVQTNHPSLVGHSGIQGQDLLSLHPLQIIRNQPLNVQNMQNVPLNYDQVHSQISLNPMPTHSDSILRQNHQESYSLRLPISQNQLLLSENKFTDTDVELLHRLFVVGERHKWKQITKEINHRSSIRRGEDVSVLSEDGMGLLSTKNVSPTFVIKQYQNLLGLPKNLEYFGVLGLSIPYVVAEKGWDDLEDGDSLSTSE